MNTERYSVSLRIQSECRKTRTRITPNTDTFTQWNFFFKEFEEEIENLRSIQPDHVSENMNVASFTNVDAEVLAVQLQHYDDEIIAELLETKDVINDNDDAIDTEDEPAYCPDKNELLQIIKAMQKFSLFSKDFA